MTSDHRAGVSHTSALADERSTLGLAVVGLAGLALGCLAALAFVAAVPFPVVGPPASGVLGTVTIHGYPKGREPLYFAVIVTLVATMPVACVAAWIFMGGRVARRREVDMATALNIGALAYLPSFPGLALGLLAGSQAIRIFAATVTAILAITVAVLAWPERGSPVRAATTMLGRRLFGADGRVSSFAVVLSGCVFGWFLPMAVPLRLAARLSSAWWVWPLAFLVAWWTLAWVAARRAGEPPERAAPRAALGLTPALLMLAVPLLIDFARFRAGILAVTLVSLVPLSAAVVGRRASLVTESRVGATLRACGIAALIILSLVWCWQPDFPGILVLPGDGDHLIAFLNDGLHGKLVYRDFWYPYGPLLYLLDLVSARISGLDRYYFPSFFVTVGLGTLLLSVTARAVYLTWPFRIVGPLLIFFLWVPEPVRFRVYAGYFAVIVAVAAAASGRAWALRLSGLMGAAAFLFSHETAIAGVVGGQAGFLWACRQPTLRGTLETYARRLGLLLSGLFLGLLPVALLAATHGALGPYIRATFGVVVVNDECCGMPIPSLWQELPPAPLWPSGVKNVARLLLVSPLVRYFYLPVLLYVIAGLYVPTRVLRGRAPLPQDAVLVGLAGFGLLLYRMALGRSDMPHAVFATAPALTVGVVLLERVALRVTHLLRLRDSLGPAAVGRLLESAVLMAGFLFLAARLELLSLPGHLRAAAHKLAHYYQLQHQPRPTPGWRAVLSRAGGRFHFPDAVAPMVQGTLDYLLAHTQPGEGVFAFPYVFRYNVLLDRPNPLTFGSCLWTAAARPVDQQRLVRELAQKKPRYIVYDESEWPDMDGVPTGDRFAEVADYIFTNYALEQKIAATSVLRLREHGPPVPPSVVEVARDDHRGFLLRGWYYPQEVGSAMTRWTTTMATLRLTRPVPHRQLFVDGHIYVAPGRPPRWLTASVDGREVGRVDLSTVEGWATLRFPIREPAAAATDVLVRLDIDKPFPAPWDLRRLGMIVTRVGFD